jgi:hypothetical protein
MKNMIKEYGDYLKDNPQGLWFKRKLYGWGWVPAKWQGWAVLAVFIGYLLWIGRDFESQLNAFQISGEHPVPFLLQVGIGIAVLIGICYWKGEKPRWQWGITKD